MRRGGGGDSGGGGLGEERSHGGSVSVRRPHGLPQFDSRQLLPPPPYAIICTLIYLQL